MRAKRILFHSEVGMRVPGIDVSAPVVEQVGGDVGYVRVVVLEGDPRH